MQVEKGKLVELFVALGAKGAGNWNDERLLQKVENISKLMDGGTTLTGNQKKLYKSILAAQKDEEEIELVDSPEEEADEDEGGGDDEEVEEKKPAKKKGTAPKKAGNGGPGVIGSICEFLSKATEKKPLTKAAILDKLCERFPDRDRDSMSKTVGVQIPARMAKEKGVEINSKTTDEGKGFWIDALPEGGPARKAISGGGKAEKAEGKPAKKKPVAVAADEDED